VQPRPTVAHNMELAPRKASQCVRVKVLVDANELKGEGRRPLARTPNTRFPKYACGLKYAGCEVNTSALDDPSR
jgi:hypothetical protein